MITGNHHHTNTGLATLRNRGGYLGPQGVTQCYQAKLLKPKPVRGWWPWLAMVMAGTCDTEYAQAALGELYRILINSRELFCGQLT